MVSSWFSSRWIRLFKRTPTPAMPYLKKAFCSMRSSRRRYYSSGFYFVLTESESYNKDLENYTGCVSCFRSERVFKEGCSERVQWVEHYRCPYCAPNNLWSTKFTLNLLWGCFYYSNRRSSIVWKCWRRKPRISTQACSTHWEVSVCYYLISLVVCLVMVYYNFWKNFLLASYDVSNHY